MENISIEEHIKELKDRISNYQLHLMRSGISPSQSKKIFITKSIQNWLAANKNNPKLLAEYAEYEMSQKLKNLENFDFENISTNNQADIEKKYKKNLKNILLSQLNMNTISNNYIINDDLDINDDLELELNKIKKEDNMVKLAQAIRDKNINDNSSSSDNYWTTWSKRASNFKHHEIKSVAPEPVKKITISDELIKLIEQSFFSFKGQEIVTPPNYKAEIFTPLIKDKSIFQAFEKISSQNNGNPFTFNLNSKNENSNIYSAVDVFNSGIPSIISINDAYTFLQKTFNFTINRYIFNLKRQHEIEDSYFPKMSHTLEHNSNIFAGVTYLLYAEYDKQYNAEEKFQDSDSLIKNKEKFEELLFYVSHAFLKTEDIKIKFNESLNSPSSKKQQDFMYALLEHTADISNLRDKYLLNFDIIASFLEVNQNKTQNITNNAQISNIYIPDISNVISKQLKDVNLSSLSPHFLLENSLSNFKPNVSNQDMEQKRSFFFTENERKIQNRNEQSLQELKSNGISFNSDNVSLKKSNTYKKHLSK